MKDEALLWFKASRDKSARDLLKRKYRTGLYISFATLGLGIILKFTLIHIGLVELPAYLILFSIFYIVYATSQINRQKKMG